MVQGYPVGREVVIKVVDVRLLTHMHRVPVAVNVEWQTQQLPSVC